MSNGNLIFGKIPQLPENWISDPESVWTVWDKNTFYLWGANQSNYDLKQGDNLGGAGLAGSNGPTRGYAHDHYIGIDTMDYSDMRNPSQFKKLESFLLNGDSILVPTFHGQFSLGTGIAAQQPEWQQIQHQIFEGLVKLATQASALQVPEGTFWPDCRNQVKIKAYDGKDTNVSICSDRNPNEVTVTSDGVYPINTISDLKLIVAKLSS